MLGGCKGTTGPNSINPATGVEYGLSFPVITIEDVVKVQKKLIDFLRVKKLIVAGGSMGGMQALEWALSYGDMVSHVIVIASTPKLSAQSIAFNAVGRNAILSDPNFNNGNYYHAEKPEKGLAIARMVGHITYLCEEAMHEKFARRFQDKDSPNFNFDIDFEVESYLAHQGQTFVDRFDANSYLYITKAVDYFDIAKKYGSLEKAFKDTKSKYLVISFSSDWLFPSSQSKELVKALMENKKDVSYCEIQSPCGHDAFLLDVFMGLENAPENLEDVFTLPDHGLEIVKNISTEEPDLEAVKASRPDQSDCFFGPNVIELCRLADITFLGLHGGEGENGKLQASFDLLGIKYTGPDSLGCAVAMHKGVAKQIFLESGVDTPGGGTIYKNSEDQSYQSLGLTLPVVVKPCSGGSSIGVYIVNTDEEYAEALKKSFRYEDELVVEPYIKGREFACGIIDGTALPPIEIIPKTGFFDYANKYQDGATSEVCPADIPEEVAERMKELTVKAFNALKLNVYSRADFLLDAEGNLFCLEMNTLPGMTSASLLPKEAKVYGIEYGDLCELIIKKSMEARY